MKTQFTPESYSCNSDVIFKLKKDVCILEDEKDLRKSLLDDYEAKINKFQARDDTDTTIVKFLESSLLAKDEIVEMMFKEKLRNFVMLVKIGLLEILVSKIC